MRTKIETLIEMGENVNMEFALSTNELPKNLFETVCAFLNTTGGYIILGINDNKNIIGIDKENVEKFKKDYSTMCNNKQIIEPTIISELEEVIVKDKILLCAYIDESSEIHKHKSKIFVRNYEGDFDITSNISLIASLHNRKRKIFEEDTIYPYIVVEKDLRADLIDRARKRANSNIERRHVWMDMSDLELLKSAGLYKRDVNSNKEGVTLAGIMLFGKDEVIRNVNPYCRTDALLRIDDEERYDDRDFVETNLLDMYDRLIDFVCKHTLDRFSLDENMVRVSPRNIMVREMVINTLMHRDITDGHTSRIIIYKDKIVCENPNSFRTMGLITLQNYTPFAKNPTLAKFFREIGYADELGSGVRRITKNSVLYSGKLPVFEDNEMFRLTIPLVRDKQYDEVELINMALDAVSGTINGTDGTINGTINLVVDELKKQNDITQEELSDKTGISLRTVKRIMSSLKEKGYIKRVGSNKKGYWQVLK